MKVIQIVHRTNSSENYQGSISDLMSALVFIFIITIVMFIIEFTDATEKKNKALEEYKDVTEARGQFLKELKKSLEQSGVNVTIDYENGILRLPESALFESGSWTLKKGGSRAVRGLGKNIKRLLNCKKTNIENLCDKNTLKVEAVFIEGHSDEVRLGPRLKKRVGDNLNLSVRRAVATYWLMKNDVDTLKNQNGKSLFSVAGYGSQRPLAKPQSFKKRSVRLKYLKRNRRIDLRFIMSIPKFLTVGK